VRQNTFVNKFVKMLLAGKRKCIRRRQKRAPLYVFGCIPWLM